jgi:hypothetical protein
MHGPGLEPLHTAFGVSLALWVALMHADELLLVYEVEAPHRWIVMEQLVSVLVLHLVPDGRYLWWTAISALSGPHSLHLAYTALLLRPI